MNTDGPFFGIDFGTTNSSMAWCDPENERAEVLLNSDGEEKTPSLVYYGEDETLVGKSAVEKLEEVEGTNDPEERAEVASRMVRSIKRTLINPPVIPIPGGRLVRPVDVVAEILKKLKRDAEEEFFHEEIPQVVITCPAIFDTREQQVLLEAAARVGFGRVEVLEEPTAAALAVTRRGRKIGKGLMVYDLGAGTFDLSVVVRGEDGSFYPPVDPQGDSKCGGDDLDLALYRYCEEIAEETLGRKISLTADVDQVFLKQCRQRKENLTRRPKVKFASLLSSENGPAHFKYEVEREVFEGLIRPRIESTAEKTARLFEEVKDRVDAVILIGGSSQVPLVERLLKESLPVEPRKFAEKDYAVALGAAYRARDVFGGDPEPIKEYRRALKICWDDRKLTKTEVEWLTDLIEKLELDPEAVARVQREILGATVAEILESQLVFARGQYRRVIELGWKDEKLDALKNIPPARLDMLLDNPDLFREYDFDDCPVSAAERAALAGDTPWVVFVMAARVALDPYLSPETVTSRLHDLADELGLSKVEANRIERKVLGGTLAESLKSPDEVYREKVVEARESGKLTNARVKKLRASASGLGLSPYQAGVIEKQVMGSAAHDIVREDEEVSELLKRHDLNRSKLKGTGKNGRVTKKDVEPRVSEQRRKKSEEERQRKERERKVEEQRREKERRAREAARPKLDLSKLRANLDKHVDGFASKCESGAKKIMDSAGWQDKLTDCLAPALAAYAKGIEKEAQAEADKVKLGLKVPAFAAPKLSAGIEAGSVQTGGSKATGKEIGVGAVIGGIIGTAIFPGVGTAIGAGLGGAVGAADNPGSYDEATSKKKSSVNVREAARKLRPALKVEANKYLDRVEKAVAAKRKDAT